MYLVFPTLDLESHASPQALENSLCLTTGHRWAAACFSCTEKCFTSRGKLCSPSCMVPHRRFFNLLWGSSGHVFSREPGQPTPMLNWFIKSNTFKFSLFCFILIQSYALCSIAGKKLQKAYGALPLAKTQKPIRSCCLGSGLNFTPQCEEMLTTFPSSNCKHEKWAQSPAQKWLPPPAENDDDCGRLVCRCLQPQAKLQHHLEAGLALPSEWACFPEHLSD